MAKVRDDCNYHCDKIRRADDKILNLFGFGGQQLKFKQVILALTLLFTAHLAGFAVAQEGHPLKGTWRGAVDVDGKSQPLVIIMDYGQDTITGLINPGRSSFRFSEASLDAPNWMLSASAMTRDGLAVEFTATLHEIGARNRYLEGTWTQSGNNYPFKVTRE